MRSLLIVLATFSLAALPSSVSASQKTSRHRRKTVVANKPVRNSIARKGRKAVARLRKALGGRASQKLPKSTAQLRPVVVGKRFNRYAIELHPISNKGVSTGAPLTIYLAKGKEKTFRISDTHSITVSLSYERLHITHTVAYDGPISAPTKSQPQILSTPQLRVQTTQQAKGPEGLVLEGSIQSLGSPFTIRPNHFERIPYLEGGRGDFEFRDKTSRLQIKSADRVITPELIQKKILRTSQIHFRTVIGKKQESNYIGVIEGKALFLRINKTGVPEIAVVD